MPTQTNRVNSIFTLAVEKRPPQLDVLDPKIRTSEYKSTMVITGKAIH